MLLSEILYGVNIEAVVGNTGLEISDIQIDSRKITNASVFVAIKGLAVDGHLFIANAIEKGSKAVVCENLPDVMKDDVTYVKVKDTSVAAAKMAQQFYHRPTDKIKIVGVTGTNGKTTIATLLYKLFTLLGYNCGLISTVNNIIGKEVEESTHTTPDAIQLTALLAKMVDAGCEFAFMEVSSHAIHQNRIDGLQFAGGIFSNITHDHLDYHKTFDEYIRVKKQFFDQLPVSAFAITNIDDKRGMVMLQNTIAKKYTYSLRTTADFKGKILESRISGLQMLVNNQEVDFRLIGEFNAYNLLAVYGAAICLNEDKQEVLRCMSMLTGAEGRFDYVISTNERVMAIVDYAHTPDALLNVLATIKKLKQGIEKVITVVGCGGDRDKAKRPIMAEVACEHSNKVVFTSDNPRSEKPEAILEDMVKDLPAAYKRKYISIADRKEAIKTAISLAGEGDIVLIAGKGHEKYQEINGVRNHFDDKEIVREIFELLAK